MAFVVLTRELSVDLVDANGAIKEQNVLVKQGQRLPDNVSPFLVNALRGGGSIAFVEDGANTDALVRDLEPQPAQVRTQDLPPVLPSDPAGNAVVAGEPVDEVAPADVVTEEDADEPADAPVRPKASDTKDVWEDYAVAIGIDRGEAESLRKADLIARIDEVEAANRAA